MRSSGSGKVPLYVGLYEQFKSMIDAGTYVEHQKLPSKRRLAASLELSPLTVDAAYQQLIAEGYVYTIERKGYYVGTLIELLQRRTPVIAPVEPGHGETSFRYRYALKTNVVDTTLFPNATWAKLARKVLSGNHHEMLNDLDPQGLTGLRSEIARYLELYRGMRVAENRIVIGSGSTSLIGMLVELLGRRRRYAIEDPGYAKIYYLFKGNDVDLSLLPLDDSGLSVEALEESRADVVHLTPSHQFPMGIVMPIQRRKELLNWAYEEPGRYIVEDDYDSEFRYQGKPIPALQGLDVQDRVIYMNTFTKTLAPSFRMGYMVLPEHLMPRYLEMASYHGCTVPNFEQFIMHTFMREGYFERHLNRMRTRYRGKIDRIVDIVATCPEVELAGYEAGLHCLIRLPEHLSEDTVVDAVRAHGIDLSGLRSYVQNSCNPSGKPAIVIGYSGLSLSDLGEAMIEIIDIVRKCMHGGTKYGAGFGR